MNSLPSSLVAALQDRYRLERELGRGGMATVYLAHDLRHNRLVALKALCPELSSLVSRDRFLREIEIAAGLQHPNILPLFDSGHACEFLYYVMPFVEGESLRDRLNREKQLSLDETIAIARQVGAALGYAHGHGVVHRDIKPGNILLAGDRAVVADFGLARAMRSAGDADLTTRGLAVGTPTYMSPEQSSGEEVVDGRSDIYSLGCVVYEMLAGEPPFRGRTVQAIVSRHLSEPPPSLRVVRPSLPIGVQTAIETALAKVRADRFPTVERFISALEAGRSGRGERRRRLWRLALVATLAGVLTGGGIWWLGLARRTPLEPNKVVVFPLVDVSTERMAEGTGEAIAVIIESALEHTEPLRWIDGWQHLDPRQRADPSLVTDDAARRIAQSRGARWYTTGTAVHHADSTTVVLRLNDVAGDSTLSQATASAPRAQAPQAGLRAVNELLVPLVAPGRAVDLTALVGRRPGAVADWLQGEREYRRGNFDSALGYLRRAVKEDSALADAALRGAQAASWKSLLPEADELARVAVANVHLLPKRQGEFARGLADYLSGKADSAVYWLTLALQRSPDWTEAHMALGEVYQHLLPNATRPLDSLAEAEFVASAADTGFAPPYFHLAEAALRQGHLDRAQWAMRRFKRRSTATEESAQLDLMLACARRGGEGVDWRLWARHSPLVELSAAKLLSVGAAYPGCAEEAVGALLAQSEDKGLQWGALHLLQGLYAAQGRDTSIVALIRSRSGRDRWQTVLSIYLIDALAGVPGFDSVVTQAIRATARRVGSRYEDSLDTARLLLLGTWYARSGRLAEAEKLHRRLSRQSPGAGDGDSLFAAALAAHILLARGDSAAAFATLEGLAPIARRDDLVWGYVESLPVERLVRAQLLHARGRHEEAIRAAGEFDHPTPVVYLPFLPGSLVLRYRAAQALAQPHRAERYRSRLAGLGRATLLQ
ncbi:MAG TPA: serine/threonine-protein kinase [Gemmatimonadales bacterium]